MKHPWTHAFPYYSRKLVTQIASKVKDQANKLMQQSYKLIISGKHTIRTKNKVHPILV